MIVTTLEHLKDYEALNARFPEAFQALTELDAAPFEKGRHEVDGSRIFVNALEYTTKAPADSKMEAHRAYADVMLVYEGEEIIGVKPVETLSELTMPYDAEKDVLLAKLPADYQTVQMKPGTVCILLPEDAHAPGMCSDAPTAVKKFVLKVALN